MAAEYIMGHADPELERLQLQARYLEPMTRRLIRDAGVRPGMRVLDLGCGAGDVSFLLAEAVGPNGSVVGIDPESKSIGLSESRAKAGGHGNVSFVQGDDREAVKHGSFDAAFGRYVLVHQRDPASAMRHVAAAVRSGGTVGFLEQAFSVAAQDDSAGPLFSATWGALRRILVRALPCAGAAVRLREFFLDAGLSAPQARAEAELIGTDTTVFKLLAATHSTLLPVMRQFGAVDPTVGETETLADRLVEECRAHGGPAVGPLHVSAWASVA